VIRSRSAWLLASGPRSWSATRVHSDALAAHGPAHGLLLDELVTPVGLTSASIPANDLHDWLVHDGLAVEHDRLLEATPFGVELGGGLADVTPF
jgi:hypothetical protein